MHGGQHVSYANVWRVNPLITCGVSTGFGRALAAVLHMRGGDNKPANVTCQTASTFPVPSSPLQDEVLVILLGDP